MVFICPERFFMSIPGDQVKLKSITFKRPNIPDNTVITGRYEHSKGRSSGGKTIFEMGRR